MAKKIFTDESLGTLVSEIKAYTDGAVSKKANSSHTHTKANITDLTNATSSVSGLMSPEDKIKSDYTNIAYGTCSTAAGTAAKVIAISGNTQWKLSAGSMITVKFSNTNTASNPTFNVNGTGAKNVYYSSSQITTSNLSYAGYKNRPMNFMYDGTQYIFTGWGVDNNSDTKVTQSAAITTDGEYPIILGYNTATSSVTNTVNKTSTLKYNPSTQILTAPTFKGALDGNATSATTAVSATSATKATQDGNGKVISSTYETKTDASAKLTEAKTYANNAANTVKNDLLNNAGAAYDTLKELGDLIVGNKDAIEALNDVAAGKANATHSHAISDVTNLQSTLDGKANSSHGTHVTYSTTAPVMDGTASVGTASTVARSDHKHPTDTSRASKTEFDSHNSDTTKHITSTERTNWNAAKTHADSAHAPSNAQPNQNAFSNIKVGTTTIAADTTTDTLTLAGTNVTITPDATNDKVTIAVADATTSAKGVVQLTNSVSSTSTTTAATPKNVKAAYDLANTAKTNAATAQSKADSAYTLADSKVDSLSDLGITATATELNYVDGVTSNIQTQLDSKLSTSGGTISGIITTTDGDVVNRNNATSGIYFYGGTDFNDGAFIGLYGKDQSNYSGQFRLKAEDGENFVYLEGRPDGTLKWGGKDILRSDSDISFSNRAIYGILPVANGGTGKMGVSFNNFLVGNGNSTMIEKTPAEVLSMINAASVSTVSTAEYTALEEAQAVNANTLYMLTDAEEEIIPQIQIITWEDND